MKDEIKPLFKEYVIFNNRCTEETAGQYIEHVEKYERFARGVGVDDILQLEVARDAHRILIEIQKAGHHRTGQPLSDSYLFKIGAMASAFFQFAIFYGIKKTPNPFEHGIGIKKKQFAKPQFFDRGSEKLRMILAYPFTLRDKALLYLLYASAIRRSEAAYLKIANIRMDKILNFKTGVLDEFPCIHVSKAKGGKTRDCPIDPLTKHYLDEHIESLRSRGYTGEWLFPGKTEDGHIKPGTVWSILYKMSKRLGFRVTPHMLRHSFATGMIESGTPISVVQQILGHEDVKTTLHYTHHTRKFIHEEYRRHAGAPV